MEDKKYIENFVWDTSEYKPIAAPERYGRVAAES
jgi:hypothetical protein